MEYKRETNQRKKSVCQILLKNKLYDVLEYDLFDWRYLEDLCLHKDPKGAEVTIEMLRLAVPEAQMEEILSLTQSEAAELITMIYNATMAANSPIDYPTVH